MVIRHQHCAARSAAYRRSSAGVAFCDPLQEHGYPNHFFWGQKSNLFFTQPIGK
jgi:hypothetical protein